MGVGRIVSFESENKGVSVCNSGQKESDITIGMVGFQELKAETIQIRISAKNEKTKSFDNFKLHIPDYQRPYAWGENQVEILLNDLKDVIESDKKSYLLGSLILHKEEQEQNGKRQKYLNIVDGQQRLVTLALICAELKRRDNQNKGKNEIEEVFLMNQNFPHSESQKNLKNNFDYIQRWFNRQDSEVEKKIRELLGGDKIEFVCIVTPNLDDAFIFFDSANSKGKKLEDYDLIKAYHLREIVEKKQESLLPYYAKLFEEMAKDGKYLSFFFEQILTPTRLWLRDRSNLKVDEMRVYDEFCKEIPKRFARANKSLQNIGVLSSFAGGVDFFIFLQKYDNLLKTLQNHEFYQEVEKIVASGFDRTRNLYVMVAMIYLDKFPCGRANYMLLLLARAVFEIRMYFQRITKTRIKDYAHEMLHLIYFSEFEEELEYKLLLFIAEKEKEKRENLTEDGEEYIKLVGEGERFDYQKFGIKRHIFFKKEQGGVPK